MSVKCSEVINAMEKLAPVNLAENWDNVGLMVGSKNAEINKALFALDCSEEVIDEAIKIKADMIITHHPFIFKGIKNLNYDTPLGRKIQKVVKNNINVYSAHTNLDIADGGTNTTLCNLLELKNIEGLYPTVENSFLGKTGELIKEMTLGSLAEFVKTKLNTKHIVVSGNLDTVINKVGLCTGKGTDSEFMALAKEKGCQCYITGDLGYHDGQFAQDLGMCIIDGTHYLTEVIVVPELCKYIKEEIPQLECICSQINGQTLNII